jgi:RsiW-degrading membrane proteinase PrsW (M82 family)
MTGNLPLMFIASFAPSLAWLGYFYLRDQYEREPLHLLLLVFGGGLLAGPICLVLFELIEQVQFYSELTTIAEVSDLKQGVYCFFAIGPIEELSKFMVFWFFVDRRHIDLDEPLDGIVYASAAALGFATIENWYFMMATQEPEWAIAITRPFNHVLFSSFWGFGLGVARYMGHGRQLVITGLVLSSVYHGLYNFIVINESVPYVASFGLILVLWVWLSFAIRHLLSRSPFHPSLRHDTPKSEREPMSNTSDHRIPLP